MAGGVHSGQAVYTNCIHHIARKDPQWDGAWPGRCHKLSGFWSLEGLNKVGGPAWSWNSQWWQAWEGIFMTEHA